MDRKIREQVLTLLNRLRMEENIPDTVYLYASFVGYADTFGLMDALWHQGLSHSNLNLKSTLSSSFTINGDDIIAACNWVTNEAAKADCPQAVVITPGTAFTREGKRMGYGGGFYDRFFSEEPEHKRVAVCYPFQIFPELPTEEHDRWMDVVLTGE